MWFSCWQTCECFWIVLELLLIVVVVLLQLLVGGFVGHKLEHRFDLVVGAAALNESHQQRKVLLLSFIIYFGVSHG